VKKYPQPTGIRLFYRRLCWGTGFALEELSEAPAENDKRAGLVAANTLEQ